MKLSHKEAVYVRLALSARMIDLKSKIGNHLGSDLALAQYVEEYETVEEAHTALVRGQGLQQE